MSEIVEKVRKLLITAIEQDKISLPTLPEVALQVREASNDPDISAQDLAKVIQNDPALTARIIKVANSPLMRGTQQIENVQMAVSRLGISYTANLATGLAMEQMFQATSDVVDRHMREVWNTSTQVAGIAHVMARHYTKLKPDEATLAGLTHQIGILPILTFAEDHPNLLNNNTVLDKVISEVHPELGVMILKKWDFPEAIRNVPREHLNFHRTVDQADYADLVMLARLQSVAGTDHPYTQMDWHQISAFERVGLNPDIDSGEDVDEDLNAEMEAAMALLRGD